MLKMLPDIHNSLIAIGKHKVNNFQHLCPAAKKVKPPEMLKINTELLTYDNDATVLIVFSKWLHFITMTGYHHAAC